MQRKSEIIDGNYFGKYLREINDSRQHGWYGNYLLAKYGLIISFQNFDSQTVFVKFILN